MADLVGARAAEILKMAAIREAAHPLSREEFEHGVSMPHGNVPGTAKIFVKSRDRIDVVGSTGRLGHLTIADLSKQGVLDAAWQRYLYLSKRKTEEEMRLLVDETLVWSSTRMSTSPTYPIPSPYRRLRLRSSGLQTYLAPLVSWRS